MERWTVRTAQSEHSVDVEQRKYADGMRYVFRDENGCIVSTHYTALMLVAHIADVEKWHAVKFIGPGEV